MQNALYKTGKVSRKSILKIFYKQTIAVYAQTLIDDGDIPSLEQLQEADFHLGRASRFVRRICFNSRIVFS